MRGAVLAAALAVAVLGPRATALSPLDKMKAKMGINPRPPAGGSVLQRMKAAMQATPSGETKGADRARSCTALATAVLHFPKIPTEEQEGELVAVATEAFARDCLFGPSACVAYHFSSA